MLSLHPDHLKSLGEDLDFIWEAEQNITIILLILLLILLLNMSHLKLEEYCLFPSSK